MRIPPRPPDDHQGFNAISRSPKKRDAFFDVAIAPNEYLHWDKIRFREPPKLLTKEQYWQALRYGRRRYLKKLPFFDTSHQQFSWSEIAKFSRGLHEIDSNARGMIGATSRNVSDDAGQRYLFQSLVEEPYWSSVLEGAATTRAIARQLVEEKVEPRNKDERMVLNNHRALEFVRAHKGDPLSRELILELHRIVTEGTLDRADKVGVFQASGDPVRVVDDEGHILHDPPNASDLDGRIQALCKFANRDKSKGEFVHPIIEAIILHFMLAYEHPFWDGNGRCARALFYWSVLRDGYWLLEYVSISTIIRKAPMQYGRAFLYTETDHADLTYFIDYHLRVIELAIKDLHAYLRKKSGEADLLSERLELLKQDLNHRQVQLLMDATKRQSARYTIAEHERIHSVSYLTARADLEDLAMRGFFRKSKDGQRSIYRPSPDLNKRLGKSTYRSTSAI